MRAALSPLVLAAVGLGATLAGAQIDPEANAPPPNGPRRIDPGWHALTHARVVATPGSVVEDATVVIRDGRIVAVEPGAAPPAGARVWDCTGRTVHAAWIDAYLPVATPSLEAGADGAHWHADVMPQRNVLDGDGVGDGLAAELRELGFGAAAAYPDDGIFRGTGAVVTLEEVLEDRRRRVVAPRTWQALAFARARDGYPRALMGSIALIRQTLNDLAGLRAVQTRGSDAGPLAHAIRARDTLLVECRDELDALRAARLPKQYDAAFPLRVALVGSGFEFRRLDAVAATGRPLVLPLAFPKPPAVETLADENSASLREMLNWEHAPSNPARLQAAGVKLALTSHRLDERSDFVDNLREAIARGLPENDALAALTTTPAELLGIDDRLGSVEVGKLANLCVIDGAPFGDDRVVRSVWVAGVRHEVEAPEQDAARGTWELRIDDPGLDITALLVDDSGKAELQATDERSVTAKRPHRTPRRLDLRFDAGELDGDGIWRLTGLVQGTRMSGVGTRGDGSPFAWTARRTATTTPDGDDAGDQDPEDEGGDDEGGDDERGDDLAAADPDAAEPEPAAEPGENLSPLTVPLGAFGRIAEPRVQDVVIRGATLWTSGPQGIVEDGVLLVRDGKIAYVGPDAPTVRSSGALEIDGEGLHVTPGLIDCHSHTGIDRGINEGTQAVTAEVRIADVLDPDDVSWYRQLAGGVTTAHQLHGSANPIGGQSQTVKLRWGVHDPEAMKLNGPKGGIKFALGENVKRSRSSRNRRYPNTRMGVEALIRERFVAARAYQAAWERADPDDPTTWPRRDLELETLAEILRGERLVHCHSYRQDEILMLCRLAQDFGFRLGTLQHGLEGYKVADAIEQAAIGASIFSDWWAYKYEVVDAIPENAAIMTRVGVVVSLNSDSDELARRLNAEAAKAVKYGGLEPAEALRLVTINPALQLGLAERIGSLETGKDADFAIWSGDPLSTFSRCRQTWIDGRLYWSEEQDRRAQELVARERARLVQKILDAPGPRAAGRGDSGSAARPGECGCFDMNTASTR